MQFCAAITRLQGIVLLFSFLYCWSIGCGTMSNHSDLVSEDRYRLNQSASASVTA